MRLGNLIIEGDTAVVNALKEKKRLQEQNLPCEHLKILCICDGGLMKGAYSVGAGLALEELGYTNVFDDFVGVSSGAASAAYFVGGNVYEGGSLIYEECCSKKFFNAWKFLNPISLHFLADALRGKTGKSLRPSEIFSSKTKLHIAVADFETAKPVFINPTSDETLLSSILASSWMPHLARVQQQVEGRTFMDGGFSSPHPIQHAIDTIDFTHVLILTSQNFGDDSIGWMERFFCKTVFRRRFSEQGYLATRNRKKARKIALDSLRSRVDAKWLLVWGDGSIQGTETSKSRVKLAVERSRQAWATLMSDKEI